MADGIRSLYSVWCTGPDPHMWCTGPDPHMCVVYRTRPSYVCGIQDQTVICVWHTGPHPHMCVAYRTTPSYVCGVQDQTLVFVWCTGPDPRICVVYRTRPSYLSGVQDQTLVCVWCTGPDRHMCVAYRTRHVYLVYHDCVCVGILCIKVTPPPCMQVVVSTPGSLCTCSSLSLSPFSPVTTRSCIFSSLHRGCGLHVLPQSGVQVPQLPSRSTAHTHLHRCYGSVLHPAYNSVHVHTYLVLPTNNACTTVYTVCSV